MHVVVVTGPPGSGKSSVTTLLHDRLGEQGIANALVEVDELERSHPPLPLSVTMRNLEALVDSYREVGDPLLFVTATIEDADYREQLFDAVGRSPVLTVRLEAPTDTLLARIADREPATWHGLPGLLESASSLAESMKTLAGVDLVIETDSCDPGVAVAALQAELVRRRFPVVAENSAPSG